MVAQFDVDKSILNILSTKSKLGKMSDWKQRKSIPDFQLKQLWIGQKFILPGK